jgi:DNA topoisomerase-1
MPTLVVVESPTKAKTLRKYLGRAYLVHASMGHVRDLPPKQLGRYGTATKTTLPDPARRQDTARPAPPFKCDEVILATDPDREGEAIAWHVVEACKKELRGKTVRRARFHEITEQAIKAALADLQPLDIHLVDAQQARRVLDRLVGYQVSPVLWKGISGPPGLSAGRVQSVALRLVVERDREIENFKPEEYWTLEADLSRLPTHSQQPHFTAALHQVAGKKPELKTQAQVQAIMDELQGAGWSVADLKQEQRQRKPFQPYITSTLQRDASVRLHWSAKKVMQALGS